MLTGHVIPVSSQGPLTYSMFPKEPSKLHIMPRPGGETLSPPGWRPLKALYPRQAPSCMSCSPYSRVLGLVFYVCVVERELIWYDCLKEAGNAGWPHSEQERSVGVRAVTGNGVISIYWREWNSG